MTYYDWKKIVKTKSKDELLELVRNRHIDSDGKMIAINELKKRKTENEIIGELYSEMLNNWISQKQELNRKTYKEHSVKYSPHMLFFASIFCLVLYLTNLNNNGSNFYLTIFLIFLIIGFFNIYHSKKELRKIESERKNNIEEIDKIIEKITAHNST